MRACEVVPLAWDATGSVRDHPTPKRTGHHPSTALELTVRERPHRVHVPGMKLTRFLFAVLALNTAAPAAAAPEPAVWPLTPRPAVVRGFELPAKPWLPGHRGVDLAGSPGQPVLAATSGTITYAGQLAGRGVVVLTTGPRRTTYEPVVPALPVGTPVTPGTVIGHLSAAGSHCAPATCLHWGLLQGTQYLNPLTLLPNPPIRLLPLTPPQAAPDPHPHTQHHPSHSSPSRPHPPQASPAQAAPAPTHSSQTSTTQAAPALTHPSQASPAEAAPALTHSPQTSTTQAAPALTRPAQASSAQACPALTHPGPTNPAQSDPARSRRPPTRPPAVRRERRHPTRRLRTLAHPAQG
ncbi:M23 family metallopeptidase [Kribbella swartbergensis]